MHLSDDTQVAIYNGWRVNSDCESINVKKRKKQLKQYVILCKTRADALKINLLNKKTSSAPGGLHPMAPHWRLCKEPLLGLCSQIPLYASARQNP